MGNKKGLETLTSPINIGRLQIRNRMVMPPMNTNFSNENGAVAPQMTNYYERRAKGGAGLIVVEAASIVPDVKNHGIQPMLYDERFVPEYAKLVERIHRYGAKASIEIVHYGSEATVPGPKYSSSDVTGLPGVKVQPLTKEQILEIEEQFVQTAYYAKMAGFDAITLHGTHGYLIAEFMSPLYNKRTDEYGGCLENRLRFVREIVQKCKAKLGNNFPIFIRISGDECIEGGRTIDETVEIAVELEKMGISAIDLSVCVPSTYIFSISPNTLPGMKGFQIENARAVKAKVNIPVILAGGIRDPYLANQLIDEGVCDFVAFGRPQIADPDFANKVCEGRIDEIRPCLSCLTCLYSLDEMHCIHCAINAEAGREYELQMPMEKVSGKKLVVIGGGPAGMETARVAAMRGYKVSLYETDSKLGGSLLAATVPPGKSDIGELAKWFARELDRLGVKVYLNTEYDQKRDAMEQPDILVKAVGAKYARFIKGSDNANVITAIQALRNPRQVGKKVVVIGGGNTGCEVAEYFSSGRSNFAVKRAKSFAGELDYTVIPDPNGPDHDVTIIEMMDSIGDKLGGMHKPIMDIKLKEGRVRILTSTKVLNISTDSKVDVENVKTGEKETICGDTVILAGGMKSFDIDVDTVAKRVINIGDSKQVGRIDEAVTAAYFLAREL